MLPLIKHFECAGQFKINLVPMTDVLPLSEISAAKMECLADYGFGDDLYDALIRYSNDSNIQISVHPVTCEYYAIYHTSAKEAYVIRVDKVPLFEAEPEPVGNDPVQTIRTAYIQSRLRYLSDIEKEKDVLDKFKDDESVENIARVRLMKAHDNLRRLEEKIYEFEQEHGAL